MAQSLKLQVILDTVNKATRPLKKITQGSHATAEALKASRDQLKTLERAQRDLRGFRELKRQSEDSRRALDKQQQEIRDLSRSMRNAEGDTGSLVRRRAEAIRQSRRLSQQYDGEQRQLRQLRDSMTRVDGVTGSLGDQQRELQHRVQQANQALQQQQQELSEVARKQRRAAQAAKQFHKGMGRASRLMGAGAGGLATGGATLYGGARMLAPGVDYGAAMSRVQALTRLDKEDPRFRMLQDQARELGSTTSFSATQAADAQGFLAMAGFDPEAIQAAMPSMLDLAKAQGADLGRTADISSNLLSGFGLDPKEMTRLSDVITATTTRANVDLEMLGESMKYVAPVAREMGLSLEESAAMAGLLGNVGIQGSQAGTTLRAMMLRLSAPVGKAAGAIEALGLNIKDAEGNMRNVPQILAEVAKATEDLGNAERMEYLKDIFGEEPAAGMAELINQQGAAGIEGFVTTLENAAGENARVAKVMADNIKGDLQGLNSAWEEIGITLTDTNEGPLRDLIQNITHITRAVGQWMKENPELTAQIATAAAGVAGLVAAGGALTLAIGSLLGPMVLTRYGLQMIGLQGGGLIKVLGNIATRAIPIVIGALRMLGAAAMANPILAIVAAIAAAALYIWTNWETLGPKFAALWQGIQQILGSAWERIKEVFDGGIAGITRLLLDWSPAGLIWSSITAGLQKLGVDVPAGFTSLGSAIVDGLIGGITGGFGRLGDTITNMAGNVVSWFKEKLGINSPSRVFAEFGGNLLEGLINGIDASWQTLRDAIGNTADAVVGWFKDKLGIHSPSRVFAELGGHTMDGYQQGLQRSERGPLDEINRFSRHLRKAGAGLALGAATMPAVASTNIPVDHRPPLSAQAAGGVVIEGGIHINVQPAPGLDEQALARYVASEVQRALSDAQRNASARRRSAIYDLD